MKGKCYFLSLGFCVLSGLAVAGVSTDQKSINFGNECDALCEKKPAEKRLGNSISVLDVAKEGDISVMVDERSNEVIFQLNNSKSNYSIKVFNILGEALVSKSLSTDATYVSVDRLDPGIYFLTLFLNDKPQETLRVVRN